ncbi:oligosaccharide flippase family protein [Halolamina sp. C58]|uniref:oligosaccharide flippase family protein n=1 Tax=Halolamina sp. C58 TaxID=3421640 RepID=UPI003EC02D29
MNVGTEVSKRFVTNVLGTVSGFLSTLLFTRFVGIGGIGSYAVFLSFQMVTAAVVSFGLFQTITKFVSAGNDEARQFTSGLILVALGTTVSTVPFVVLEQRINAAIGADAAILVPLGVGSWMAFRLVGSFLEGQGRVALAGLLENGRYILILVAQLALYSMGLEVFALLWGVVLGQAMTAVLAYVAVARVVPARPSWELFTEFLRFSKYTYMKSLSAQIFKQADYIILGLAGTPVAAGIYKVSFTTAEVSMLFSAALSDVSFPEFSRLDVEEMAEATRELLEQVFAYTSLFSVPIIAGGAVVGNGLLLTVFDVEPQFTTLPLVGTVGLGNVLIVVLGVANLLNGYRGPLENYYFGTSRPRLGAISGMLLIVVYGLVALPLLNAFDSVGLALATSLSFGCSVVLLVTSLDHPIPKQALYQVGAQSVAALGMASLVAVLSGVIGGSSGVLRLSTLLIVGAVTYFVLFISLSARARRDAYWVSRDLLDEL